MAAVLLAMDLLREPRQTMVEPVADSAANSIAALERVLLALWVGGIAVVGLVVAPVLFAVVEDSRQAGDIAGAVFHWVSLLALGLLSALLLLRIRLSGRNRLLTDLRQWLLATALIITAAGAFYLAPQMATLRDVAAGGWEPGSAVTIRFQWLHRVASGLFIANMLIGVLLLLMRPGRHGT